jgi:hypothetical protein
MKIFTWAGALAGVLFLASCGQDRAPGGAYDESMSGTAAKGSTAEPVKLYPTKTGIIEWKTDVMGDMTTVVYFDDYGAKQASYTTTEIKLFNSVHTSTNVEITVDGWVTKYDPEKQTGYRERLIVPLGASNFPDIDELRKHAADGYPTPDIEELPSRTILGREAQGYSVVTGGMKMRGWVWEKIPLRTEIDMGLKSPMIMEVTRLELGAEVPAEKFEVPADVVITELGT